VRATDTAGNTDPTPATYAYTVDTAAPDTTITAGEPSPTNDPMGDFQFTSSEAGSTFECSVDGGPFGGCSSPFSTPFLSDGSHTFAVRAIDAAGNTDPTPATATFTVDTAAPNTFITSGPAGPTNNPRPTLEFTASEADSSFQCRLDSGPFNPCSSPFTTPVLTNGTHTFAVRATDSTGNTDPTPGSATFTVDTNAP
jgi:hypothetical protein